MAQPRPILGHSRLLLLLFTLLTLAAAHAGCAARSASSDQSFEVSGRVEQSRRWTVPELASEFAQDLQTRTAVRKGSQIGFRGVPLIRIVDSARPRAGGSAKNADLTLVVVVTARDGYSAAFSLCELREEYGQTPAWIAIEEAGEALSPDRGPVQLIVPNDAKASRWVHGISTIRVVQAR